MRLLANDRSIVIEKVDKGSSVDVWNRVDCIAEAKINWRIEMRIL